MGKRNKVSRIDAQLAAARVERHNEAVRADHAAQIAELPPGWQRVTLRGRVLPVPEVPQRRQSHLEAPARMVADADASRAPQADLTKSPSLVSSIASTLLGTSTRGDRRRAQRATEAEVAAARRGLARRRDAQRRTDALREHLGIPSKGE
jgi:hypothetical protein